eukprot:5900744-Amphidinium_carterae.2
MKISPSCKKGCAERVFGTCPPVLQSSASLPARDSGTPTPDFKVPTGVRDDSTMGVAQPWVSSRSDSSKLQNLPPLRG